jgi:magnesium and cobalt transporter
MPDTHIAAAPTRIDAAETPDADPSEGQSRGFFSRIIGALAPSEPQPSPQGDSTSPREAQAHGMSNLRRMRVEDVLIPKPDIVAVPVTIGFDELVGVFRDSGLTRIPVYDGTLDSPLGFVNLKDFALKYGFGRQEEFDIRSLLRNILFVPPSMALGVLLQKMQADRIHMALVIDEYGGTDGLVTIEDLLETVVGDIDDEHDEEEAASFLREKPGVWLAQATTELAEFRDATGIDLTAHDDIDAEEVDTLGGLVFMLAGHVPARGEVIGHPDGPEFEIVDADPRRIKRLRIRLGSDRTAPPAQEPAPASPAGH